MPRGMFISYRRFLDGSPGGVQACTQEYLNVIEAAGIELTVMGFDADRRLSTRILRQFDSSHYRRPTEPALLERTRAYLERSPVDFIFLNQVSLASIAGKLREQVPPSCRIVLLSHGMESTDLLHLLRQRGRLPLSGRARPWGSVALGRLIQAESDSRRHVDGVLALSPFDVELEHWMGSRNVDWLPRTITSTALDWRPVERRLGYVGTLDHAPNLEGLVAVADALAKMPRPSPRIRVVGGGRAIGAWLTARFPAVDYLGALDQGGLEEEAASWTAFMHPIFCYPRGCSTKLATAIGWRIPIITTPQGRRGYEWREGALLECTTPEDFARATHTLFEPGIAAAVQTDVRRVAATSPTLPEVAARMRDILGVVASGEGVATPAATATLGEEAPAKRVGLITPGHLSTDLRLVKEADAEFSSRKSAAGVRRNCAGPSMSDRTVLIVSPHFPPSTLASVHRARHLAKHLPALGWRPVILRVDERCYTEPGDPGLAALVPSNLDQVRVGALPARMCRLVGVGDIGLRAFLHLRAAVGRAIAAHHPHVVLITGSPFYPMLLAPWIRRRFGLPVVLDFQDPWLSAEGALRRWGTKGWLAHRMAAVLEPAALSGAAFVTSVSDIQNEQMALRYPRLDHERMAAIPIGGDPDDFVALRARIAGGAWLDPTRINFSYVGTFLPRAAPLIEALFAGLGRLRRESPDLAARLRLNFIGTSNQPTGVGGHRVQPYADAAGVGDLVRETPQRISYLDALDVLANSDVLMLIGSDEPHYTASKIYPALLSGRPFLSLFHEQSSAHHILSRVGGGRAIAFHRDLATTASSVTLALRELACTPETVGAVSSDAIAPYTGRAVAARFAEVFDLIAAAGEFT